MNTTKYRRHPGRNPGATRAATVRDIDAVVQVLAGAYNATADPARIAAFRHQVEAAPGDWRVLLRNGVVTGCLHVQRQRLRVGRAVLVKADLGHVAVAPNWQGHGLGTVLLRDTVRWMQTQPIDLSRLGGLHRFYGRFGYTRFPRRYVEFAVGQTANAGAARIVEGRMPVNERLEACIRAYRPATDAAVCRRLFRRFHAAHVGAPLEPFAFPAGPGSLVFAHRGRIVAYLFAVLYDRDMSDFEAPVTILDAAWPRRQPAPFQTLLTQVINTAVARGVNRLTARLSFEPATVAALASLPVRFRLVETYGGLGGNMLRIVNLASLFDRLAPELSARLDHAGLAPVRTTVAVRTAAQAVVLGIDRTGVRVVQDRPAMAELRIGAPDLLRLVLGLQAFDEIESTMTPPAVLAPVLRAIFPRRAVFSGTWG